LLKAFAKERKKYLLDKTPILFASSVILTWGLRNTNVSLLKL
jgi:hypothetical protein